MADTTAAAASRGADGMLVDDGRSTRDTRGEWVPDRPPLDRGVKALLRRQLKNLFGFPGMLWPWPAVYAGMAAVTWLFLQPGAALLGFNDLSGYQLRLDWILLMYARNVGLALIIYGGWHLPLYWQRIQGTRFKYNKRWLTSNSRAFLFRNQLWDNVFWTLVSGVGIWTIYEALLLWAYAQGWLGIMEFRTNPVWFVAFFPAITIWNDFHFYFVHRLLHWKPLYRAAHYLHHRNVNVGPWSGLAMHPIEHVIYLTRWLILLVVPSHPLHLLYVMHWAALGAAPGHTGFEEVVVRKQGDVRMPVKSFNHYLHHRYFECNYSGGPLPLDRLFGTFHDGSPEAHARMRANRKMPKEAAQHL